MNLTVLKCSQTLLLTVLYVVCLGYAAPVRADQGIYIHPQGGIVDYTNGSGYETDELYGLGVGYRFSGPLALEADYLTGDTRLKSAPSNGFDVDLWSIRALYYFGESDTFRPFATIGVGEQDIDLPGQGAQGQTNAGLGLRWKLLQNLDLRTAINFFDGENTEGLMRTVNLGLQYRFGKSPKSADMTPADTDADGVIDSQDLCLGSPKGAVVDVRGCQVRLDEDNDGIEDAFDQCLGTTDRTRSIDSQGCYIQQMVTMVEDMEVIFYFDFDSYATKPLHQTKARQIATFLQGGENHSIELVGHTDSRGSSTYNQKLSLNRAEAVKMMLLRETTIPADRISTSNLGESDPAVANDSGLSRSKNRRVTATVRTTRQVLR